MNLVLCLMLSWLCIIARVTDLGHLEPFLLFGILVFVCYDRGLFNANPAVVWRSLVCSNVKL